MVPFRMAALPALLILGAGCQAPDFFPIWKQPGVEVRHEADGRVFVPDTGGNWKTLKSSFSAEVTLEAQGLPPPGGWNDWTDFWHRSFSEIRGDAEHPERYFALVLDLRRRAGLPDLPQRAIEP